MSQARHATRMPAASGTCIKPLSKRATSPPGAEPLHRTARRDGRLHSAARPRGVARHFYIVSEKSSRPISMRRISLVPAPIS